MFESDVDIDVGDEFFNISFDAEIEANSSTQILKKQDKPHTVTRFSHDLNNQFKRPINTSCRRKVKRKFPGPAGILSNNSSDVTNLEEEHDSHSDNNEDFEEIIDCSQEISYFNGRLWLKMREMYKSLPLDEYKIDWIKINAPGITLRGEKVPFLAAIIARFTFINMKEAGAVATLKDTTGEIQAYIQSEIANEHASDFEIGSVVVLKEIPILTPPNGCNHYLTITASNLVEIFSNNKTEKNTQCTQNSDCLTSLVSQKRDLLNNHTNFSGKYHGITNNYSRFDNTVEDLEIDQNHLIIDRSINSIVNNSNLQGGVTNNESRLDNKINDSTSFKDKSNNKIITSTYEEIQDKYSNFTNQCRREQNKPKEIAYSKQFTPIKKPDKKFKFNTTRKDKLVKPSQTSIFETEITDIDSLLDDNFLNLSPKFSRVNKASKAILLEPQNKSQFNIDINKPSSLKKQDNKIENDKSGLKKKFDCFKFLAKDDSIPKNNCDELKKCSNGFNKERDEIFTSQNIKGSQISFTSANEEESKVLQDLFEGFDDEMNESLFGDF